MKEKENLVDNSRKQPDDSKKKENISIFIHVACRDSLQSIAFSREEESPRRHLKHPQQGIHKVFLEIWTFSKFRVCSCGVDV